MSVNPFQKSYTRSIDAKREFRDFQTRSTSEIQKICESIVRFKQLEEIFAAYVTTSCTDQVQLWFGNRSMFRKLSTGAAAVETGPCLLYTLAESGHVAVVLYPAKSDLGRVQEDHLYLGLGYFTSYQLMKRLRSDILSLSAYGHVTSYDGDPSFQEKFRIFWLRQTRDMQKAGSHVKSSVWRLISKFLKTTPQTIFGYVLAAVLGAIFLTSLTKFCLHYGWSGIANLLGHD